MVSSCAKTGGQFGELVFFVLVVKQNPLRFGRHKGKPSQQGGMGNVNYLARPSPIEDRIFSIAIQIRGPLLTFDAYRHEFGMARYSSVSSAVDRIKKNGRTTVILSRKVQRRLDHHPSNLLASFFNFRYYLL
jgi:hypothetical protein